MADSSLTIGTGQGVSARAEDLRTAFRSGYVIEIVDTRKDKPVHTHVFALNPGQYSLSEPFNVNLTGTEADTVVAEENGTIVREITIEGTEGFSVKTSAPFRDGAGPVAGGLTRSGAEHHKALKALFRRYSQLKKDPLKTGYIQMVWHSLADDDHFYVSPRSFDDPRDSSTRVHRKYRISLAVTGVADRSPQPVQREDTSLFGEPLKIVDEALNDARAVFAEITSELSEYKRKVGNINAILIGAASVIRAVSNALAGGVSLVSFTAGIVNFSFTQFVDIIEDLSFTTDQMGRDLVGVPGAWQDRTRQMERLEASLNRIAAFPDLFRQGSDNQQVHRAYNGEANTSATDIENRTAGATVGTRTRLALGSRDRGSALTPYNGLGEDRVERSDTIDTIASRNNTTPETLITINDLRYPYISSAGGEGCLRYGDSILVPVNGSGLIGLTTDGSNAEALYGSDFSLDYKLLRDEQLLDFAVDEIHGGTDVNYVAGLANVAQGCTLIVEQELGSLRHLSDIGINRTAGVRGTASSVILASLNLRKGLLKDPRVSRIIESRVILNKDVLSQEVTAEIRGQKDGTKLVLPLGSTSGE